MLVRASTRTQFRWRCPRRTHTTDIACAPTIETVLCVVTALPHQNAVAALSSGNLSTITLPPSCRQLIIAVDDD